jgi:anti-sigma factor RsiW
MACDQQPMQLSAYLDGELMPADASALEQHLRACPYCAAEIADALHVRRGMAAARGRFAPDPAFKQRVLRGIGTARSKRRWFSFVPAAVATATIALVLAAFLWNLRSSQQALREQTFREVADLHLSDVASVNPVDVVSTDRHTVKPWFAGRIPFSFNLPELAGSEFSLIGGRVAWLEQEPGAQLLVGLHQHRISVLIFRDVPGLARALPSSRDVVKRASFNMSTWTGGGLRFFVVSDADPQELAKLTQMLQQANP